MCQCTRALQDDGGEEEAAVAALEEGFERLMQAGSLVGQESDGLSLMHLLQPCCRSCGEILLL
jgi:hypothetical protein